MHVAKPGWVTYPDGRRIWFRSRAERRYADFLEIQRRTGLIASWEHEPRRYVFPDRTRAPCSYTPDFEVTRTDGVVETHEVKGSWSTFDRERIRLMARLHPEVRIVYIGARMDPKDEARIERARELTMEERAKEARRK